MTTSFPFLRIARFYSLDYGQVVRAAEFIDGGGGGTSHFPNRTRGSAQRICEEIRAAVEEERSRRYAIKAAAFEQAAAIVKEINPLPPTYFSSASHMSG